jgi:catechol 2,3-dioxygenase-like lactoylglutathione lyase family enzyme
MKIVPVIKTSDLQRSLLFYTEILDFERKWPGYEDREMANGVIDLVRDGAEVQLSRHAGDGVFGSVNRVFVDDVDELFACGVWIRRGVPSLLFTPDPLIRRGDCASSPSPILMATTSVFARRQNNGRHFREGSYYECYNSRDPPAFIPSSALSCETSATRAPEL